MKRTDTRFNYINLLKVQIGLFDFEMFCNLKLYLEKKLHIKYIQNIFFQNFIEYEVWLG